jgi:hypothetical protein
VPTSYGSINLLPPVADYAKARADQLGLLPATLFRILLQGYLYGPPLALPASLGKRGRLKRIPVQCSLPAKLRREGRARAKRWRLSFSELMELLLVADADKGGDALTVYPPNQCEKPGIDLP